MENVELLLENLVSINSQILDELRDMKSDISSILEELNWAGEHTFAEKVTDGLTEIESSLDAIDTSICSLDV